MKWSDMAIDFYKSRAVVYIYCRERPGVALIYLCEQYYYIYSGQVIYGGFLFT